METSHHETRDRNGTEDVYLPTHYAGNHGLRKALWLAGQVPDWPADELPQAFHGFHEDWRGESGYGEFRRVEGFSMYVDRNDAEICVVWFGVVFRRVGLTI